MEAKIQIRRPSNSYAERGDFMFSFDLKSGYHHVDIAELHQKYLGFEWDGVFLCFHCPRSNYSFYDS